jgi:hypothetical protein
MLMAHNGAELCEEVAIELQLFQNPMPSNSDLQLNIVLKPLFYKTRVMRI